MKNNTYLSAKGKFLLGTVSLVLASCGGGGGSSSSGVTTASLSGAVLDGYITGATVCLDLNSNGKCDSGEPTTVTTANGAYSFNYPSTTSISNLNVIVSVPAGAVDSNNPNTPIAVPYTLAAPASNSSAVTPLTTLVVAAIAANPNLTPTTAATQVTTSLGLPSTVNLFQNYIATPNTAVQNVAQVVNVVVQNSSLSNPTSASSTALTSALSTAATYATQAYTATTSTAVSTILNSATVASSNGALIATVPAPSYSQTDALAIYNQLSTIRANAGAGLLAENSLLDQAATAHAAYLVNNSLASNGAYLQTAQSNGTLGGHFEVSTNTGYTGATPQARATALGYSGSVNEVESFGSASGQGCISSLEDSVYHLINLLSPYVDIGLTFNGGNNGASVCTIVVGLPTSSTGQFPAAGSYVTYPYNGQTGVLPTFYNQAESPTPASDLPKAGHPIVISLYNQTNKTLTANQVVVNSFTLTTASGASVPVRILVAQGVTGSASLTTDANFSSPGFVVILPLAPLSANTNYTANFAGLVSSALVDKSWAFITGANN
jgi:uncharacterized protein YkwD